MAKNLDYMVSAVNKVKFDPNWDKYAFFHSGAFKEIFGATQKCIGSEGYVKISSKKKNVYLRFRSINCVKKGEIQLSYLNRSILNVVKQKNEEPAHVSVTKTNWFRYHWNNTDVAARHNFRWAFIGFLTLIVVDLPQLIIFIRDIIRAI